MTGRDKKKRRRGLSAAAVLLLIAVCVIGCSAGIAAQTDDLIAGALNSHDDQFTAEETEAFKAADPQCILVLGAAVRDDGTPSDMLRDRLDTGIALYEAEAAPKLLLSGDNGQVEYNEVESMLAYTVARGVPEEDIFLDHAGFSTYDSVYRAKAVFGAERLIVVTQRYHLYRALYGCESMGIRALGAGADQQKYTGRQMREFREVLARDKDMVKWRIKPEPTFLGDPIPIAGDGRVTQ